MSRGFVACFTFLIVVLLTPNSVSAGSHSILATCRSGDDLQVRVQACSEFIGTAKTNKAKLGGLAMRADLLVRLGKPKQALADIDSALEIAPDVPVLQLARGGVLLMLGRNKGALEQFDRALAQSRRIVKIEPNNYFMWVARAKIFNKTGDYHQAIDNARRAIRIENRLPYPYAELGRSYTRLGKFDHARDHLSLAKETNFPGFAETALVQSELEVVKNMEKKRKAAEPGRGFLEQGRSFYSKKKYDQAAKLFRKASDAGNLVALSNLAIMTYNGKGVKEDTTQAHKLLLRAADKKYAHAMYRLANSYEEGWWNGTRDLELAEKWKLDAARNGHVKAMSELAVEYETGLYRNPQLSKAVHWYLKAAENEDYASMFKLAKMYEQGNGVPKDHVKAARWFSESLVPSNDPALIEIRDNAHAWSQEFRIELQQILREWRFYDGPMDGKFGTKTLNSIAGFVGISWDWVEK